VSGWREEAVAATRSTSDGSTSLSTRQWAFLVSAVVAALVLAVVGTLVVMWLNEDDVPPWEVLESPVALVPPDPWLDSADLIEVVSVREGMLSNDVDASSGAGAVQVGISTIVGVPDFERRLRDTGYPTEPLDVRGGVGRLVRLPGLDRAVVIAWEERPGLMVQLYYYSEHPDLLDEAVAFADALVQLDDDGWARFSERDDVVTGDLAVFGDIGAAGDE
jgi:hypothetical protein